MGQGGGNAAKSPRSCLEPPPDTSLRGGGLKHNVSLYWGGGSTKSIGDPQKRDTKTGEGRKRGERFYLINQSPRLERKGGWGGSVEMDLGGGDASASGTNRDPRHWSIARGTPDRGRSTIKWQGTGRDGVSGKKEKEGNLVKGMGTEPERRRMRTIPAG